MRIFNALEFNAFPLANDLYEHIGNFGILKKHGAQEAYAEKVILSHRILCDRNISDHLYDIADQVILFIGNARSVDESDIARAGAGHFKDHVARVALSDLLLECEIKYIKTFDELLIVSRNTLAQDIVTVARKEHRNAVIDSLPYSLRHGKSVGET